MGAAPWRTGEGASTLRSAGFPRPLCWEWPEGGWGRTAVGTGHWGHGGKALTVAGRHSPVPGAETGPLHAAIGHEGHLHLAGVGVEGGGRHPATHPAGGQVGGDAAQSTGQPPPGPLLPKPCRRPGGPKAPLVSWHLHPPPHPCSICLWARRWGLRSPDGQRGDATFPKVVQPGGGRAGPRGQPVLFLGAAARLCPPPLPPRQGASWGRATYLRRGPPGSGEISRRSKGQEATPSMLSASTLSCTAWPVATWMCHVQRVLGG